MSRGSHDSLLYFAKYCHWTVCPSSLGTDGSLRITWRSLCGRAAGRQKEDLTLRSFGMSRRGLSSERLLAPVYSTSFFTNRRIFFASGGDCCHLERRTGHLRRSDRSCCRGGVVFRRKGLDVLSYADVLAFGLPLGVFIGRLGCFYQSASGESPRAFSSECSIPTGSFGTTWVCICPLTGWFCL